MSDKFLIDKDRFQKRSVTFDEPKPNYNVFAKNKAITYALLIGFFMLLCAFFFEKSKPLINLIPLLRGEVSLENGYVITTIQNQYPLLIRKNDPFIGTQLRYSGNINSVFSEAAEYICAANDSIVEVGAYFGFNTIRLGKKLNSHGKIYAFEPNSDVFSCLRKSIYLNGLENVIELRNSALSDQNGDCSITDVTTLSRKENGELNKGEDRIVHCQTLDNAMKGHKISLLLIDLPGQEFTIINHAHELIEKSDTLKILVSFKDSGAYGSEEQTLDYLISKGYICYYVTAGPHFEQIDKTEIMKKCDGVLLFTKNKL